MNTLFLNRFCAVILAVPVLLVSLSRLAVAATEVENPGDGPDIWVDFSLGDPELDEDFRVDFTDEDYPKVELLVGDDFWFVWSVDTDNPNDIGDIGTISSPYEEDFGVTIWSLGDGGEAGARNIKGIDLHPTGFHYSNLLGSEVSGSVEGNILVWQFANTNGQIELEVGGDVDGTIFAFSALDLTIVGEAGGDVTVFEVSPGGIVDIDSIAAGKDVQITAYIWGESATLRIRGGLPSTSEIRVLELVGTALLEIGAAQAGDCDVDGDVWVGLMLDAELRIWGDLGGE